MVLQQLYFLLNTRQLECLLILHITDISKYKYIYFFFFAFNENVHLRI